MEEVLGVTTGQGVIGGVAPTTTQQQAQRRRTGWGWYRSYRHENYPTVA
jgi:hypothetical protein